MSDQSPLSVGQAVKRWIIEVSIFLLAGGIAAGGSALLYESISQASNPVALYAVIFAAGGLLAYRHTERVLDSPNT